MKLRTLKALTVVSVMAMTINLQATTIENVINNMDIAVIRNEAITKQKDAIKIKGIITETLNTATKLRSQPNEKAEIITILNEKVHVLAEKRVDNWYQVKIDNMTGYIYKSQIDESDLNMIPYTRTETKVVEVKKEKGEEVLTYAKQFLGNPYVYGGNSLTKGVDCSGFTSQVYKHFGIQLQRSSRAQYTSNGYKVNKNEIKTGDLVFYGNNGVINHVAIYAGNNQIIHANDAKTGIKMSKLEYGKPMIGIKRIIK